MTKTILILAIAAAFIAGMLVSAPQVFAPSANSGGDSLVSSAIDRLTQVMQNTATQGPAGPQGEQGIQGSAGPQGPPAGDLTFGILRDSADSGHLVGWNPDGSGKFFSIAEPSVSHSVLSMSVISINVHDVDASFFSLPVCSVIGVGALAQGGAQGFNIACTNAPGEFSTLGYTVMNP